MREALVDFARGASGLAAALALAFGGLAARAQEPTPTPTPGPGGPPATPPSAGPSRGSSGQAPGQEFPPLERVTEGYEKVVSTSDGSTPLYTVWHRAKDAQLLAGLPRAFANQRYFMALTVASGDTFAGLQGNDIYFYWKQYDKRLAMIEPNVAVRSTGDNESKASVNRLFTDRVITDIPILTVIPNGGPVIDLDQFLVSNALKFFGAGGAIANPNLVAVKTVKAFPQNIEIGLEGPGADGKLRTLHFSISLIPDNNGYQPRKADQRIGYFTTGYDDYGVYKNDTDETRVRYINRWRLEKADPSLKISPPKKPIVFYIEHTTPVRYRRWVREGVLMWNKAFENVGIANAIEVYYQDAASGAHMDKDPEDVRYNFLRWLNNNVSTAIGPSRAHPLTGEILDADIVLTDGWIRAFYKQFDQYFPKLAMEGYSPETVAWLTDHPEWDPRYLLSPPGERDRFLARNAQLRATRAVDPEAYREMIEHALHGLDDEESVVLRNRRDKHLALCMAAHGKAFDLAVARMHFEMGLDHDHEHEHGAADANADDEPKKDGEAKKDDEKKPEPKKPENLIDGMPEDFIGPMLADLVAHEVGHTLGLRHNFRASGLYTLEQINSEEIKGKKPFTGSVMDYNPVNINMETGKIQGDYTMIDIGPYDMWAIEYGYGFYTDPKPITNRVAEPELQYATDEDTGGPDPLARRYDFSKNPLDYAKNQVRLAKHHRENLLERFVKDGDSWSKLRKGYEMTLGFQTSATSMMANWLGGSFIYRDKKGDKGDRAPVEVVPAADQREALKFVIENTFHDEAFGLTPDLLVRLANDRWTDGGGRRGDSDPTWPVHDRIQGIQASALTSLMNPTTLRRIFDNELRVPADQDAVTLAEVMDALTAAAWSELEKAPEGPANPRKPLISSLRRNLQREHVERLIGLTLPGSGNTAALKPISDLSALTLRRIHDKIEGYVKEGGDKIDAYTLAHLDQARERIAKVLNSQVIYNIGGLQSGNAGGQVIILGGDGQPVASPRP